jgi:SAM-dependent methyltransferase
MRTPAKPLTILALAAPLAWLLAFAGTADGKTRAECEREYTPQRAQEGKDVIWEPTEDSGVVRMLEMAHVTPADKVYDLGSGDGKIPIAAAKLFGATAVGIEYDAGLVKHSRCLVEAEGVQSRVTILQGDIFTADFHDATVVALYLLPALNLRLRPTLLAMPPGTRVVSYSFTMGEWQPDEFVDTDDGSAYFWIVPADAGGTWTFRAATGENAFDATLEQTFQLLRGTIDDDRVTGRLSGRSIELAFTLGGMPARLTGTVDAGRVQATVTRGGVTEAYVGTRRVALR